ncbi:MAG: tryptophan-rich sensory protein [Firmicutes bacterium]|nr:tryptophan-rich sensory protein [Bacillota bacterium]
MEWSLTAFLFTLGVCLASLIVAGATERKRKDDKEWFANLKHPDNAFLLKALYVVGFIFFPMFGFILYTAFVASDIVSIVLATSVIVIMGFSPLLKYKTRNLSLFFYVMLVLPVITIALIIFLFQTNIVSAILAIVFMLWLVYDLSYYYRLMKLNKAL